MPRFNVSPRAAALPLVLFALLLLLAACGTDTSAATLPAATDTLPPAPSATTAATATRGAATSGADVSVGDFQFSPDTISVKVGSTVDWTNTSTDTPHTVTSDTGAFNHTLNPGDSFRFTFTKAGTFHYHCSIHPSMTAIITVTG